MTIYLPIAEMSVDALLILALGAVVGFLSGVLGVGGGFLLTPLLLFIGIPAPVAVASQANQLVASSVSGVLAQWRRGNLDIQIGTVMIAGGVLGAVIGVWLFGLLRAIGQADFVIALSYVLVLGSIGSLMLIESAKSLLKLGKPASAPHPLHERGRLDRLPLKMHFRKSRLTVSALIPAGIGFVIGILASIMGVGGGFLSVPAMIYLLGMPTAMVIGTSLFQIIFIAAIVTFLQAVTNHTVDFVLALFLLAGGVVGAQFGTRFGAKLRGEQVRALLALLILAVAAQLFFSLVAEPSDHYELETIGQWP